MALSIPKFLGAQYLFGLIGCLIVAWILVATADSTTFASRVAIVTLIGLFAGIIYDMPYWNWYGFPTDYIVGHIVTNTITWAIAGLGMAAMIKKQPA
jgi:hydrogenase/urease accessory protein HupE